MSDEAVVMGQAEPEFAALAALDWGDSRHRWKLINLQSGGYERGELESTPEALQHWAAGLNVQFGGKPIALCLEQSRGAVVYQLGRYEQFILYPVHPTAAAKFREFLHPSGSKSDISDADVLLELLQHHRHRLRPLRPDTAETRSLQMLVEARRRLVDEKTRHSNQLTALLKMYFPQVLSWIDDIDSPLGCDLLERWPTLQQIQHAHAGTLKKFFLDHNCRSAERIEERIGAIRRAVPATTDAAMLQAGPVMAGALVTLLRALNASIEHLQRQIEELAGTHPERPLFAALPGVGKVLLPRLIAAFGTDRERWASAADLQSFSGIAPVMEQSGNTRWVHFRWRCPRFFRQTFHEFADHSRRNCPWAQAYYLLQIGRGKRHHAAVRALAFKWIRILFRCWRDRTPYNEGTYTNTLAQHASPLATAFEWQATAGFQKLSIKKT